MFEDYSKVLHTKILDTVNASVPADIGILTYVDGGLELVPGEIAPCIIPDYLKDQVIEVTIDGEKKNLEIKSPLKNGDKVIYARTSKVRQYVILGVVSE